MSQALGKTVMLPEQETQRAGSLCGLAGLLPESSSPTCSHPASHHCRRAEQSPHHIKSPILPGMLMFMYTTQVKWRKTHPRVPGSQRLVEGPGPHATSCGSAVCSSVPWLRNPEGSQTGFFFPVLFQVNHSISSFGISIISLLEHYFVSKPTYHQLEPLWYRW